jgi:hypothetical protein
LENFSSTEKGQAFEDYVKNVIFPKDKYDLIHQTHSFDLNKQRFIEESKNPDFIFRCRESKQEFHIEAKWRSGFDSSKKMKILEHHQLQHYKKIESLEKPVFLIIGFEGSPSNPRNLSLIPLKKIKFTDVYWSFLNSFSINKSELKNSKLNDLVKENSIEYLIPEQKKLNYSEFDQPSSFRSKKIALIITLLLLIFGTFFILRNYKNENPNLGSDEIKIKKTIENYYKDLSTGNAEILNYYLNPVLDKWYSSYNVSASEVIKSNINYFKKYPKRVINIDWNSFQFTKLPNDDYNVTYLMDYQVTTRFSKKIRSYHLKIFAIWSKDLKLKSLYEEKM